MLHTKRRLLATGCATMLIAGTLGLAAYTPLSVAHAEDAGSTETTSVVPAGRSMGKIDVLDKYTPALRQLDDGTIIQRTPSERVGERGNVEWTLHTTTGAQHPDTDVPYNTFYLKADGKGCGACHEDLTETLDSMEYDHMDLVNQYGTDMTVQMCFHCHTNNRATTISNSFGDIIHGIHSSTGIADCMDCHTATNDGNGLQLWDAVKYDWMRGITKIDADTMDGTFDYRIDMNTAEEFGDVPMERFENAEDSVTLFYPAWQWHDTDYALYDLIRDNAPLDEETEANWTITFTGNLGEQKTFSLSEIKENAPVETKMFKWDCLANPIGGPWIGQVEVTGVPLQWFIDQLDVNSDTFMCQAISSNGDGHTTSFSSSRPLEQFLENEGMVYWEINGKPLSWAMGYPVSFVAGGQVGDGNVKQISEFNFQQGDDDETYTRIAGEGKRDFDGNWLGKPQIGFFDIHEGEVFKVGEPVTIQGYADGYNETIAAIEITMDGGETWKTFETPDTNTRQLTTWTYTFTPDQETAYRIGVRAVTETGLTTSIPPNNGRSQDAIPLEIMINAKNEIPTIESGE